MSCRTIHVWGGGFVHFLYCRWMNEVDIGLIHSHKFLYSFIPVLLPTSNFFKESYSHNIHVCMYIFNCNIIVEHDQAAWISILIMYVHLITLLLLSIKLMHFAIAHCPIIFITLSYYYLIVSINRQRKKISKKPYRRPVIQYPQVMNLCWQMGAV